MDWSMTTWCEKLIFDKTEVAAVYVCDIFIWVSF